MSTRRYLKEPPPSLQGRYERAPDPAHVKIVKALQRKPEQWMAVREFQTPQSASAFARKIKESKPIAFREGRYEANSRSCVVWARYLGDR